MRACGRRGGIGGPHHVEGLFGVEHAVEGGNEFAARQRAAHQRGAAEDDTEPRDGQVHSGEGRVEVAAASPGDPHTRPCVMQPLGPAVAKPIDVEQALVGEPCRVAGDPGGDGGTAHREEGLAGQTLRLEPDPFPLAVADLQVNTGLDELAVPDQRCHPQFQLRPFGEQAIEPGRQP